MNIPFTTDQFFQVIENYNSNVFPVQFLIIIFGLLAIFFVHSEKVNKDKWITGILGLLWIWIGFVYHLLFFTSINQAAYIFGLSFILQGLLFLIEGLLRNNLQFELKRKSANWIAYFLVFYGLIIYPILLYFIKGSLITTITLGLPCPSTIFTFGLLILVSAKFPKYLLIIPTLWAIIGTSAAINFSVYPDYLMPVSALIAIIFSYLE